MKHFMILGNGDSGTSLLRGMMNAHPYIECLFEYGRRLGLTPDGEVAAFIKKSKKAEKEGLIWGNKIPYEQFITRQYEKKDILKIGKHFKVIWMIRRFNKHYKPQFDKAKFEMQWSEAVKAYWMLRDEYPKTIIQVSFEDLICRPEPELYRICSFLDVPFFLGMLDGTQDTGHDKYDQIGFNLEKI